jgi:hypothetical protein
LKKELGGCSLGSWCIVSGERIMSGGVEAIFGEKTRERCRSDGKISFEGIFVLEEAVEPSTTERKVYRKVKVRSRPVITRPVRADY